MPSQSSAPRASLSGLRLLRVGDIDIVADFSLLFVVALIAVNLGAGLLPAWHPEWSNATRWSVAVAAALLFIMSTATHELAHALVARAFGLPINRIVLFLFGGMAQLKREPDNPHSEFWMAVVGPAVSLLIGVSCAWAGVALTPDTERLETEALSAMSHAPPFAILLWLGPINVMLALFNLVPGFPLDGGRGLRALLWWWTGDFRNATRIASRIGQGIAWIIMSWGILMIFGQNLPYFGRGFGPGLWLLLIGWFLNHAARNSFQQLVVRQALSELTLRDIMDDRILSVVPELTVADIIRERVWELDQQLPVTRGGVLLGLISPEQLRAVPPERWAGVHVAEIMTPVGELAVRAPEDTADEVLELFSDQDAVPVIDHERLVGIARREDVHRWLAWHLPAST